MGMLPALTARRARNFFRKLSQKPAGQFSFDGRGFSGPPPELKSFISIVDGF
jgi:hypothetical protein